MLFSKVKLTNEWKNIRCFKFNVSYSSYIYVQNGSFFTIKVGKIKGKSLGYRAGTVNKYVGSNRISYHLLLGRLSCKLIFIYHRVST